MLRKMLEESDFKAEQTLLVESDNCSSQYKSTEHFVSLMSISKDFNVKVIRLYGVAGHGKGEVDHVGGLTKVIWQMSNLFTYNSLTC